MRTVVFAAVLSTLALGGCATPGPQSDGGGGPDHITSQEIRDMDLEGIDAYDAIRRLRPTWLRSRGTSGFGERTFPKVFVDGLEYGQLGSLRGIPISDIEEFHYLGAQDATTRFGTGYPGGAILVTTR